jgi:creatinine amidohydrolase
MRPYILAESNWKQVKEINYEIALLPWGATEPHNYHLPYTTDNYEAEAISYEAAKIAWENGVKVVVLPTIPFGVNTGQKNLQLTININPSTQLKLLSDIVDNLNQQGIKKLVIMNGHGGNDFKSIIREAGSNYPQMFLCSCTWYQSVKKEDYFEHEGDHADELETSVMLYLKPDLVLPLNEAGDGKSKKFSINALNEKWAWTERKWSSVSKDTGIGNPSKATKEKGEKFFNDCADKVSGFLIELAKTRVDDMYCG